MPCEPVRQSLDVSQPFLLGEHRRSLDERYRLSLPADLADRLCAAGEDCVLTKERAGVLGLWNAADWRGKLEAGIRLVQDKMQAGRLDGRLDEVQTLGRLLSTRHTFVRLAGRARLSIPEGFREFLGVAPGGELLVVGAAVSVELWRPEVWFGYIEEQMPEFRRLFDQLSG
jgi:MraZ protein